MLIRELAALVGVSPDTVINWELRGVKPKSRSFEKVNDVLALGKSLTDSW